MEELYWELLLNSDTVHFNKTLLGQYQFYRLPEFLGMGYQTKAKDRKCWIPDLHKTRSEYSYKLHKKLQNAIEMWYVFYDTDTFCDQQGKFK